VHKRNGAWPATPGLSAVQGSIPLARRLLAGFGALAPILYHLAFAMRCYRCAPEAEILPVPPLETIPDASTGEPAPAVCSVCGRAIETNDPWQALLRTLTQLARFGLDSEGRPLLEPASED
jgi:hypothetical protein